VFDYMFRNGYMLCGVSAVPSSFPAIMGPHPLLPRNLLNAYLLIKPISSISLDFYRPLFSLLNATKSPFLLTVLGIRGKGEKMMSLKSLVSFGDSDSVIVWPRVERRAYRKGFRRFRS
jgi:hypothetical protein